MTEKQKETIKQFLIKNCDCKLCYKLGIQKDCKNQKCGCVDFFRAWLNAEKL